MKQMNLSLIQSEYHVVLPTNSVFNLVWTVSSHVCLPSECNGSKSWCITVMGVFLITISSSHSWLLVTPAVNCDHNSIFSLTGHRQLISDCCACLQWSPCCGHSHVLVMGTVHGRRWLLTLADTAHGGTPDTAVLLEWTMNSVRFVHFNIWLISLMSCVFSLCLSKCHKYKNI